MMLLRAAIRRPERRLPRGAGPAELVLVLVAAVAVVIFAALDNPDSTPAPDLTVTEVVIQPTSAQPDSGPAVETASSEATVETATTATMQSELPGLVLPSRLDRYQVQRGETLASIATAEDTSVEDLVEWNEHINVDSVLIRGEWILIPRWHSPAIADESAVDADEGTRGRGGG